jgi:fermentation-respiration switch protein FrsA (DUF1100 family)
MTLEMPDPLGPRAGSGSGRRSPADPHAAGQGEPAIRDLPARATVVVRTVEPMATVDVGALVDRALPAAGARITAAGLTVDGPPIVRYLEWGGATADLEIGFPVAGPAAAIEGLPAAVPGAGPGRSALPGGRCVVAEHVGPYQDLPATWGRLMAWVWDRGLEPAGPVWESYTDNPDLTEPALLRTEVIRPIRS